MARGLLPASRVRAGLASHSAESCRPIRISIQALRKADRSARIDHIVSGPSANRKSERKVFEEFTLPLSPGVYRSALQVHHAPLVQGGPGAPRRVMARGR
jgi:hypothetical protein